MKSAPAIAFDYRPSRWLLAATAVTTGLALVALTLCAFDAAVRVLLAIVIVGYAMFALRRFVRIAPRRLAWHTAGHWRIVESSGVERVAELERAAIRGAWIALTLRRSDKSTLAIVLGPDNSDVETRRRVRVRLARGLDEANGAAAA